MSNYAFAPSPDLSTREQNFAFWENGFSEADLDAIRSVGESLALNNAVVGTKEGGEVCEQIRKSKTGWINYNQCPVAYDKMAFIARSLNGQFFDFDIHGFVEDMQYTVYGPDREHYDWHMDKGLLGAPRKLSLVLQLSDPSEYEGGDLEFMTGKDPVQAKKGKGIVYAFPSYIIHRVTPVTRGTRRTLVVWVAGPKFR